MYSFPLWYELPVLVFCLSLIDAIRRVIAQNLSFKLKWSRIFPVFAKATQILCGYTYVFHWNIFIPLHLQGPFSTENLHFLFLNNQYPSQIQDLTVLDIQTHTQVFIVYPPAQPQFKHPFHITYVIIFPTIYVKWCLPIKQFRDLSALIFCLLPVLAMMCQSKHFMLNMGPVLCCFSFRVG